MKIKEFSLTRYGPLSTTGKIQLDGFNLFFGRNEDGKTLTIDAIVKLLLGSNVKDKDFQNIQRVEETPEGYVIMEDDGGKDFKFPEKGNLTKISGLSSSECRNIFIIRDSDLSVNRESEFYTGIADRLIGLRTDELLKIKENLKEIGKITPNGTFRDIKIEKLKTRIDRAEGLVTRINVIADRVKKENSDKIEEDYVTCKEEIDEVKQEIEGLDDSRKREKFEKGKDSFDKLKQALVEVDGLKVYNIEDDQLWINCEKEIEAYKEEKGKLSQELNGLKNQLKEASKDLSEKERNFQILEERKKKIDNDIRPDLKNFEEKRRELAVREVKNKYFVSLGLISAIFLGLSLIGAIVNMLSPLFQLLILLFLFLVIIFGILRLQFISENAKLAGEFERLRLIISKFELNAGDVEGIFSNIQTFDDQYSKNAIELNSIKTSNEVLQSTILKLEETNIPDVEGKIRSAENKIDGIKKKSKEESLSDYTKKFFIKQGHETSIGEEKRVLGSIFGEKSIMDDMAFWSEEIKGLEKYKDKSKVIKYDENRSSELKDIKRTLDGKLEEINRKMRSLQTEMGEIERQAKEILLSDNEFIICNTTVDLKAIKDALQRFIDENESNKENVLSIMEIFDEIETEEKEKVSDLFGNKSATSTYFKEITNNLYEEVSYNKGTGKIEVRKKDGKILEAEKLSGGAYDQLYLSIRLALGEKLLKGKKGFFIMDDPFVKADPDRLKKQIEMLGRIKDIGWQILYFSSKSEIKDILKDKIDNKSINYIEVQGITC
ncbi:MAG: AAA family ATPase [Candidatus Methanoperedens sp.]